MGEIEAVELLSKNNKIASGNQPDSNLNLEVAKSARLQAQTGFQSTGL